MTQQWLKIYQWIQTHKAISILGLLCLLLLFCYPISQLRFTEEVTQLVPDQQGENDLQETLEAIHFSDQVIVHFSTEKNNHTDALVTQADAFVAAVNACCQNETKQLQGKISPQNQQETYVFIQERLPVFLTDTDYQIIENRLAKDSVHQAVSEVYNMLSSPAAPIAKRFGLQDPLGFTAIGLKKLNNLQQGKDFKLYQDYITTKNGKSLLLFLQPKEDIDLADWVSNLQQIQSRLSKQDESLTLDVFGSPTYSVANANQIKTDMQWSLSIALSVLMLVFILFYRKIYIPIMLFIPIVLGCVLALGSLAWFQSSFSLIALGIGAVLIGIAIDYGLHILTHSRNQQHTKKLYESVSSAILLSALTTATAFICLLFVGSKALRDLGLFAAISILAAAFFALLILPQVYQPKQNTPSASPTWLDRFAATKIEHSRLLLIFILGIAITSSFFMSEVRFEKDLSQLNFESVALKQAKNRLSGVINQDKKTVFLVHKASTLEQALQQQEKLQPFLNDQVQKDAIASFSGTGNLVLSAATQAKRIERWNRFWTPERRKGLQRQLNQSSENLGIKPEAFQNFTNRLSKTYQPVSFQEYQQLPAFSWDKFIQHHAENEFYTVLSIVKVHPQQLSDFKKKIANFPDAQLIDREGMYEQLVADLASHFNSLIAYSFLAVLILLALYYRNYKKVLISIIPVAVTWVIALGIMGFFNISFNPFNIIVSTFIFGLGVDYSIFMTNGLQRELDFGESLTTYKTSIILSVLTTLLGMGALVFAKHPALHSLALISIIGILTAVLVSFSLQAFLFRMLIGKKHSVDA